VLDFDSLVDYDAAAIFDPSTFPKEALDPEAVFLEETYAPLLKAADKFAPRVQYEAMTNVEAPTFQDRTKAHAPERVACVNAEFDPQEAFRLVIVCKERPPAFLADKVAAFDVAAAGGAGDAVWAGGERPRLERDVKQQKLDTELLECAFDGDLDGLKKALEQGADAYALDGRMASALSEAAVQGHTEVMRHLLDNFRLSDPNGAQHDGRTPLHRAAFNGHMEAIALLLESGSDPRRKDRAGQRPFDLATGEEAQKALEAWDVAQTDKILVEWRKLKEVEEEKLVKSDEERKRLERGRQFAKLEKMVHDGEKELLDIALVDLQGGDINSLRDAKGNTLLHSAATSGKQDICELIVEEGKAKVDSRDSKGWTPLMVAAFYGHKKLCVYLRSKGADALLMNAYHKSCIDVARDDEIKEVLLAEQTAEGPGGGGGSAAAGSGVAAARALASSGQQSGDGASGAAEEPEAKAEGKAKAKAKAKGEAKAKGKAKGKAKAKAR